MNIRLCGYPELSNFSNFLILAADYCIQYFIVFSCHNCWDGLCKGNQAVSLFEYTHSAKWLSVVYLSGWFKYILCCRVGYGYTCYLILSCSYQWCAYESYCLLIWKVLMHYCLSKASCMCTINTGCFPGTNDQSPLILRLATCSLMCGCCGSHLFWSMDLVCFTFIFAFCRSGEGSQWEYCDSKSFVNGE